MKKFLLFSLLIAFGYATNMQAQEKTDAELSHWSANAKVGLNWFRVSPTGSGIINSLGYQGAGTVEYTFNPLFGVGGELALLTFNRSSAISKTLDATAYASLNATNLLLKERTGFWNNLNVYTNIGVGLNYFSSVVLSSGSNARGISAVVPTTILAELRLTKSLSLGAEAQYRFYLNETIGGLPVNGISADAFVASGSIRYKLGAVNKTHVRNMTYADFYPAPVPVIVEKIVEKAVISDAELNRFKAIEDKNAALEAEQAKIKVKLGEVKSTSSMIEERTALNSAELKRIKAVEDMNVLLLAEVGKIKTIEDKNTLLVAEVAKIKAIEDKNTLLEAEVAKIKAIEDKNAALEAEVAAIKSAEPKTVETKVIETKVVEVAGLDKIAALEEKSAQLATEQADLRDQVAELKSRPAVVAEGKVVEVVSAAEVKRIKALEIDNEQLKAQIECLKKAVEEAKVVEVPEVAEVPVVKSVDTVIVVKETVPVISEEELGRIKAVEEKNAQLEADVEKLKELLTEMKEKANVVAEKKCAKEAEEKKCAKEEAKPCAKDAVVVAPVVEPVAPVAPVATETVTPVVVEPVAPVVVEPVAPAVVEEKVDLKALAGTIKFKFNSNELEASSLVSLNKVVTLMKATPALKVKVSGYTDNIGSVEINKALSLQRANAVKAYMVSKGADAKNIKTVGEGVAKPIASNDTAEGRAKNRRVEIEVAK